MNKEPFDFLHFKKYCNFDYPNNLFKQMDFKIDEKNDIHIGIISNVDLDSNIIIIKSYEDFIKVDGNKLINHSNYGERYTKFGYPGCLVVFQVKEISRRKEGYNMILIDKFEETNNSLKWLNEQIDMFGKYLFCNVEFEIWKWFLVSLDDNYFLKEYKVFLNSVEFKNSIKKDSKIKSWKQVLKNETQKVKLKNEKCNEFIDKYVNQFSIEYFKNNFDIVFDYNKTPNCKDWTYISQDICLSSKFKYRVEFEDNLTYLVLNDFNDFYSNTNRDFYSYGNKDDYLKQFINYNKSLKQETYTGSYDSIFDFESVKDENESFRESKKTEMIENFVKNYSQDQHKSFLRSRFFHHNTIGLRKNKKYRLKNVEYFFDYLKKHYKIFLENNVSNESQLKRLNEDILPQIESLIKGDYYE